MSAPVFDLSDCPRLESGVAGARFEPPPAHHNARERDQLDERIALAVIATEQLERLNSTAIRS